MVNKYLKGSPYYLEDVLGYDLSLRLKNGMLTYLLLNQPPICNYSCRRCFMQGQENKTIYNSLTNIEYSKIINDAYNNGVKCVEVSGEGEPTMSESIKYIIEQAYDKNMILTLITNGSFLTKEFIEFCFNKNVTLVVSLFSLEKELYEKDNGCIDSYDKVISNIELLASIYSSGIEFYGDARVYRHAIHTTVQTDNLSNIKEIELFCNKNDIFFSVAPLAKVGGAKNRSDLLYEISEEDIIGDNSIILSKTSINDIGREVCGTCLYGLNIGYNGDLLLDAHAGYEIGSNLGNVRYMTYEQLFEVQKSEVIKMFKILDGFCPVRNKSWGEYIKKYTTKNELCM